MARSARPSVADLGGRRRANAGRCAHAETERSEMRRALSGHDQGVSTVVMHAVVSVDGFVADAGDDVGPLFEWYPNRDAEIVDGARSRRLRPRSATCARCRFQPRPRPWLTTAAADGGGSSQ